MTCYDIGQKSKTSLKTIPKIYQLNNVTAGVELVFIENIFPSSKSYVFTCTLIKLFVLKMSFSIPNEFSSQ